MTFSQTVLRALLAFVGFVVIQVITSKPADTGRFTTSTHAA